MWSCLSSGSNRSSGCLNSWWRSSVAGRSSRTTEGVWFDTDFNGRVRSSDGFGRTRSCCNDKTTHRKPTNQSHRAAGHLTLPPSVCWNIFLWLIHLFNSSVASLVSKRFLAATAEGLQVPEYPAVCAKPLKGSGLVNCDFFGVLNFEF